MVGPEHVKRSDASKGGEVVYGHAASSSWFGWLIQTSAGCIASFGSPAAKRSGFAEYAASMTA